MTELIVPSYLNCQHSGDSTVRFPMGALPPTLFGLQTHAYLPGPSLVFSAAVQTAMSSKPCRIFPVQTGMFAKSSFCTVPSPCSAVFAQGVHSGFSALQELKVGMTWSASKSQSRFHSFMHKHSHRSRRRRRERESSIWIIKSSDSLSICVWPPGDPRHAAFVYTPTMLSISVTCFL